MNGLDVFGEGTGDPPPPMEGAYLLVQDRFGLELYRERYGTWEDTVEGWAAPQPGAVRWWLLRVRGGQ